MGKYNLKEANSLKKTSTMEVPGGSKNKVWVLISELLGTAFLTAALNWGGRSGGEPICVGLAIFIMAQVFGPISGGHFNPAVTIAVLIKHRHERCGPAIFYTLLIIIAQVLGAMLGCATCLMGFPLSPQKGNKIPIGGNHYLTQLCPANGCNDGGKLMGQTFLVEFVMTFLFVAFVIQIVKHNGAKDVPINAAAIGIALYTVSQTAGGISGGCINPAIGAIQPVFQKVMNARIFPNAPKTSLIYQGAYIGAPLLGGIFAGVFHRFFNEYAIRRADNQKKIELEMAAL